MAVGAVVSLWLFLRAQQSGNHHNHHHNKHALLATLALVSFITWRMHYSQRRLEEEEDSDKKPETNRRFWRRLKEGEDGDKKPEAERHSQRLLKEEGNYGKHQVRDLGVPQKPFAGMRICKEFHGKWYNGHVDSNVPTQKTCGDGSGIVVDHWKIAYDNGD